MPQMLFPHSPVAMGVEVALLSYFAARQPIPLPAAIVDTLGSDGAHAALAGASYYVWNVYIQQMVSKYRAS